MTTEKREQGGKRGEKKKITVKIVATNVVTSRQPNGDRLQHRPLVPDMEIMAQPSSLASRNYLNSKKLFGKSPVVFHMNLQNVINDPFFKIGFL